MRAPTTSAVLGAASLLHAYCSVSTRAFLPFLRKSASSDEDVKADLTITSYREGRGFVPISACFCATCSGSKKPPKSRTFESARVEPVVNLRSFGRE